MDKEKILLALKCCSEFYCDDCPYQKYESKDYPLRCIHKFTVDLYDFLRKEGYYEENS